MNGFTHAGDRSLMSVQLAARPLWLAMLILMGCGVRGAVCEAAEDNPSQITECQYACGAGGMDLKTLHDCGITIVSHIRWTLDEEPMKRYLAEAHKLGIKVLPYVSPEKAWFLDTPERRMAGIIIRKRPGREI